VTDGRTITVRGGIAPAPEPLAPDLRVGTEFGGYRIDAVVGRGGMGVVYRAEQVALARTVALKLLVPEFSKGEGFRERFVREARTAAAIHHPNVVAVYDAGEVDGLLYIAMQFVEGSDLAAVLAREGALAPARALAILGDVAAALDAAHASGVVHRDVKPGNVLLGADRAYLADFGLTRAKSNATVLTQQGTFVGTLDYVAPEQIEGTAIDARADVYSFGCVLYQCLVGNVPYEKESQASLLFAHLQEAPPPLESVGLPPALDAVVAKTMAKRPDERFATCSEAVAAACAAMGEQPLEAPAATPVPAVKVIVASSDAGVRAMARATLNGGRFRLVETDDADKAVAAARREAPDLVLLEASAAARSAELSEAGAKVVLVGAKTDGLDVAATGAHAQLGKPFSALQLLYTVGDLLGHDLVT
jgi:predicted Ser/Thr protein kinase